MKNECYISKHNKESSNLPNPGLTLDSLSFINLQSPKSPLSFDASSCKIKSSRMTTNSFFSIQPKSSYTQMKQPLNNLFLEKQIQANTLPRNKPCSITQKNHNKNNGYLYSSANTLRKVLDPQTTSSPSDLRTFQSQNEKRAIEEFNTLTSHTDNNPLTINSSKGLPKVKNSLDITINDYILDSFVNLIRLLDPIFNELSLEEKIRKCFEMTKDDRKMIRLGAAIALYLMIKKYQDDLFEQNQSIHDYIIGAVIELLLNQEKQQEELFRVSCLEILSLYDPNDYVIEQIEYFCGLLEDFNYPLLQQSAFNLLMTLEYDGLKALVEIACDNKKDYAKYVLNQLLQTPHIQKTIIAPALIKVLYSKESQDKKISSLAALNRMYDVISDKDLIDSIYALFTDKNIPKDYIANILRTTNNKEAEGFLLKELENSKDFAIRNSIANVFGSRSLKTPPYLIMNLDNNDSYSLSNQLGSFCSYFGNKKPVIEYHSYTIEELIDKDNQTENIKENSNDYLIVNMRDFRCALNRMLTLELDHSKPRLVHAGHTNILDWISLNDSQDEILNCYAAFFEIVNSYYQNKHEDENQGSSYFISPQIVKALNKAIIDFSTIVRETALVSIGNIGLPEGRAFIRSLIDNINDKNDNVSSKIIWTIGKLAQGLSSEAIPPIINRLQSTNIWKVKKACLYALGKFGSKCDVSIIPYLVKLFKESIISKEQICFVILQLGNEGERALLQLLCNHDLPMKLLSIIIQTFAYIDLNSANIDFIIEKIYQQGSHSHPIVRKSTLETLCEIFQRSTDRITYLEQNNIIPFFFDKLGDKDSSIQALAIECVKSLGPQGELVMIEGFTKDDNSIVRANCAQGLAEMGSHNIRTIIHGLCEEDIILKRKIEELLQKYMSIDSIIQSFTFTDGTKGDSQLSSLLATVQDVLENKYDVSLQTVNYLTDLQNCLEEETQRTVHICSDYDYGSTQNTQSLSHRMTNESK